MNDNREELLDNKLAALRKTLASKQRNIEDLEKVLHDDLERAKKIPRWFIAAMVVHFFFMLSAWCEPRPGRFVVNCVLFLWTNRRLYREVHGVVAPLSLAVMIGNLVI